MKYYLMLNQIFIQYFISFIKYNSNNNLIIILLQKIKVKNLFIYKSILK